MGKPHRNSPQRAAEMAARAVEQLVRRPGFTPSPRQRPRFSTRGMRKPTWLTKAHTPSRLRDMQETNA